ncbi:MAG: hypothetical protein UCO29_07305 [Blautia hansenii]|nr:hypothetical protein [Blautia hansenii]MEE0656467.1 hypothetical protein [Blautia hansenii]
MDQNRNKEPQKQVKKQKPVTVKITEFRENLSKVVAESELPPFLLEILLGEYLTGVSRVAAQEYAQDRAEWEETDG